MTLKKKTRSIDVFRMIIENMKNTSKQYQTNAIILLKRFLIKKIPER